MSRRMERIAEQLKGEIARVLLEEVTDPRVRMVTLTRVDCAPDLSNARVYWSSIEARDAVAVGEVADGLASAASFVRRSLAEVLPLRRTPRLEFHHDPSLEQGAHMLSLLKEISDGE
ncbi:MAG: 30S ribosome-binding factor RbfA [Myxococcota bacterium]